MNQKNIREHNGNDYTVAEAAEWLKELDDRTKSSKTPYNSIDEIAGVLKDEFKINVKGQNQNYFKAIRLEVTSSGSYIERVLLLLPVVSTNTSHYNKMYGRVIASKTGGNVWNTFDISAQSVYNNTCASFSATGQYYQHKLVTCTYNGVNWLALKFAYHANPYNNYWFEGFHIVDPNLDSNEDALKVIDYYMHINGSNPAAAINTEINNSIQDYTGVAYRQFSSEVHVNGNVNCVSLIQSSDKKFKKNIEEIDGEWALSVFKKLKFSFYDFSKTNSKQAGLIAQEVEKILPQAVHTSENGDKGLNHTYIDMICKAGIQHFIKTQIQ
ncbi:tail fiber domain-containing protein [Tenacibaculum maritimum]|nr:tail fiber domain-containing protein [Tenacibaculum maritimum]MDB0602367.1 tail fiber domain-containing protein [Tenacibaculum maritimum]MDB0613472.1 tail fiber domain-containing protein [Tenacibaculum maritimum]